MISQTQEISIESDAYIAGLLKQRPSAPLAKLDSELLLGWKKSANNLLLGYLS